MLQHAGPYNKSLTYVISASLDPCNECALVALVTQLPPKELVPSSLELGRPPPCKKKRSVTLPPWHRRVQVRANAELDFFLNQDFYLPISLSRSSCSGLWMEILVDFLQIDSSLQPYGLAISMENQYRQQFPWTSTVLNEAFAKPNQRHRTFQKTDNYHPLTKNILTNTVPTTPFNNSLFDKGHHYYWACTSFQSTEDRNWIGVTHLILKKSCLPWSPEFILAFLAPYSLICTGR